MTSTVANPCGHPQCPLHTIVGAHHKGVYLHNGEHPVLDSEPLDFGLSNPPASIWFARRRINRGEGDQLDHNVVHGFIAAHRITLLEVQPKPPKGPSILDIAIEYNMDMVYAKMDGFGNLTGEEEEEDKMAVDGQEEEGEGEGEVEDKEEDYEMAINGQEKEGEGEGEIEDEEGDHKMALDGPDEEGGGEGKEEEERDETEGKGMEEERLPEEVEDELLWWSAYYEMEEEAARLARLALDTEPAAAGEQGAADQDPPAAGEDADDGVL
ncbi:MAG: hypothetical protein LQ352_000955 [Teloschistes flavicans]|nr:MAG: hypothetical protein LQ352_000955 [Teloschistes flavicans]